MRLTLETMKKELKINLADDFIDKPFVGHLSCYGSVILPRQIIAIYAMVNIKHES